MIVLQMIPVVLSLLLLAAHFLRAELTMVAVVCVIIPALLLVRRPWSARILQLVITLGALEWLRTLVTLAQVRTQLGEPWTRMAIILGAVALFTALSALTFQSRAMSLRYGLRAVPDKGRFAMNRASNLLLCLALSGLILSAQAAPWIDPAYDTKHFGPIENVLFWEPDQQVAGYRNMDRLTDVRWIHVGEHPLVLPERAVDLDPLPIVWDGGQIPLADYLEQESVAGLLVVKDGAIVYERYRLGNDRNSRWISYSVAKSVVSMLVGAAIRDGYIGSVDEKVTDYLPRLKGSAYEQASIGDVLHMSSGVAWNETYDDPESDINQVSWATLDLMHYLGNQPRKGPPGEIFNYSTAEINLVGALLRAAVGNNLSTYLEQKIWQPFGMESDANWNLTEPGGAEFGGCCINATLRDYARLGLFALQNGQLADGTPVLPTDWMARSTTPAKSNPRYGYLWWLDGNGAYEASGIFGQGIFVYPQENLVIALHSARPDASREQDWKLEAAMYKAVAGALKEPASP